MLYMCHLTQALQWPSKVGTITIILILSSRKRNQSSERLRKFFKGLSKGFELKAESQVFITLFPFCLQGPIPRPLQEIVSPHGWYNGNDKRKKFPWTLNSCGVRLLALSLHWLCGLGIAPLSLSFLFYKMWMNSNVYLWGCCKYLNEIASAGSSVCILPTIAHTQSAPRTHSQIPILFLGYAPLPPLEWSAAGKKQEGNSSDCPRKDLRLLSALR